MSAYEIVKLAAVLACVAMLVVVLILQRNASGPKQWAVIQKMVQNQNGMLKRLNSVELTVGGHTAALADLSYEQKRLSDQQIAFGERCAERHGLPAAVDDE